MNLYGLCLWVSLDLRPSWGVQESGHYHHKGYDDNKPTYYYYSYTLTPVSLTLDNTMLSYHGIQEVVQRWGQSSAQATPGPRVDHGLPGSAAPG